MAAERGKLEEAIEQAVSRSGTAVFPVRFIAKVKSIWNSRTPKVVDKLFCSRTLPNCCSLWSRRPQIPSQASSGRTR